MTIDAYKTVCTELQRAPRKWLVTGAAGFIGSNLLERLLTLGQHVVGLDNESTGSERNISDVLSGVSPAQAARFRYIRGDICDPAVCAAACDGAEIVLHQAALGSVPRSIADPATTNRNNVDGFLNMLVAARDAGTKRFVYASSSSVYGDCPDLPKVEERIGRPLSPYALTKQVDELYAGVFTRLYGLDCIGLRYFNVFGRRQSPSGAYAAVIPRWFAALVAGTEAYINGDGETSRDFCYIDNVLQANLLAACTGEREAVGQAFNIACGERTTLNELFGMIRDILAVTSPEIRDRKPVYRGFLPGDVRHSHAAITRAATLLGYRPVQRVREGLALTAGWYRAQPPGP